MYIAKLRTIIKKITQSTKISNERGVMTTDIS